MRRGKNIYSKEKINVDKIKKLEKGENVKIKNIPRGFITVNEGNI